jgi:transposase
MRLYRKENHLEVKYGCKEIQQYRSIEKVQLESNNLETYEAMTKEELIQELIKARITEARLKKGYEVKGDGSIIQYSNKNTK